MSQSSILELIKRMSGQANLLVTPVLYLDITGNDHKAALFLNQCVYWSDRSKHPENWFYKTDAEWYEELRLTREMLDRIVNKLENELGVIKCEVHKVGRTPKTFYKVIDEKLEELIEETIRNVLNPQFKKIRNVGNPQFKTDLNCVKPTIPVNRDYMLTETTSCSDRSLKEKRKPKEPKEPRKRDERLDNEFIKAYRSVTHLSVPISWRDLVISGCEGKTEIQFRDHVIAWIGRGYNPANIQGIMDTFKNGGLSNGRKAPLTTPPQKISSEEEEFRKQNPGVKA